MKVWITKYALSTGKIIEAELDSKLCESGVSVSWDNGTRCNTFWDKEWHNTKEEALFYADKMRQKKITSLKKQIERLEKLRFE